MYTMCEPCNNEIELQLQINDLESENRQLKRALWLARAKSAVYASKWWDMQTYDAYKTADKETFDKGLRMQNMWDNVATKCRAKAEEFLIKEQK